MRKHVARAALAAALLLSPLAACCWTPVQCDPGAAICHLP